jgi:hypothetical protein
MQSRYVVVRDRLFILDSFLGESIPAWILPAGFHLSAHTERLPKSALILYQEEESVLSVKMRGRPVGMAALSRGRFLYRKGFGFVSQYSLYQVAGPNKHQRNRPPIAEII